jgi:hypothetical protein
MSPKVTLSVPKDLSEKMEQWKDKFNFSSVFQEAISKEINKKESYAKKIKENATMETVIERLKKEKMEEENEFYEIGKTDGLQWSKGASYRELKYAAEEFTAMFEISEDIFSYDPKSNEILGDYFSDIFDEYKDRGMGWEQKAYSNYIPNKAFQLWEQGWKEVVEDFWEEVKGKI